MVGESRCFSTCGSTHCFSTFGSTCSPDDGTFDRTCRTGNGSNTASFSGGRPAAIAFASSVRIMSEKSATLLSHSSVCHRPTLRTPVEGRAQNRSQVSCLPCPTPILHSWASALSPTSCVRSRNRALKLRRAVEGVEGLTATKASLSVGGCGLKSSPKIASYGKTVRESPPRSLL